MGELLSTCCGSETNDPQPIRGGWAPKIEPDPAYVTDNHPGGCDVECGNGDGGGGGGCGGCGGRGGCGG